MKQLEIEDIEAWYQSNYQNQISGRRIVLEDIEPLIENLGPEFSVKKIGESFLGKKIQAVKFGNGKIKILIWTQMHGNESSGTKALFDLLRFIGQTSDLSAYGKQILNQCQILCIPILNPDGAVAYTRVNAQQIDLNRDVIDKKAPESRILQDVLVKFDPDFCFNMHDQRTIFSIGEASKPATLSFLAPSEDKERTVTKGRIETMKVIVSMSQFLNKSLSDQIGRYTDEFYPTATGDNFQKMGYNTILIESGHFNNDYQREITRKFTFFALLQGILYISDRDLNLDYQPYFKIPDNEKKYLDIIVKDVYYQGSEIDLGILFQEKLINEQVCFVPKIDKIQKLTNYNADKKIEKTSLKFQDMDGVKEWLKNYNFYK